MSMFAVAFPDEHRAQRANLLLGGVLGFTSREQVGRFRDCWIEKADDRVIIAVYTRNGGGNREAYADQILAMQSHPQFITDADDGFDSTYATFRFEVPEEQPEHAKALCSLEDWDATVAALREHAADPVDTDARWQDALRRMGADL